MKWLDITDDLNDSGKALLSVGELLFFEKVTLRIMRKHKGKVWAKRVHPMTIEQFEVEADKRRLVRKKN